MLVNSKLEKVLYWLLAKNVIINATKADTVFISPYLRKPVIDRLLLNFEFLIAFLLKKKSLVP